MEEKIANSVRFIESYNKIDEALRNQHNFKRSLSFSDMIRKAASINLIARKYEDDLIDYGRLRNAIIHKSNDNFIIAEPHEDVTLKMEKIAKLICTPPKIIETNCVHDVFTVAHDVSVANVIEIMAQTNYSNIPVFKDGCLIGVANGKQIIEDFGKFLLANKNADEFLHNTTIEQIVTKEEGSKSYALYGVETSVDEIMSAFYSNRKLMCVVLTKTGKYAETPVGIITVPDYMELNKIVENY